MLEPYDSLPFVEEIALRYVLLRRWVFKHDIYRKKNSFTALVNMVVVGIQGSLLVRH